MSITVIGGGRMGAVWLAVRLYMQTQDLIGSICQPREQRLLDILNGVFVERPENSDMFLKLSGVTIFYLDGTKERQPTAYINKATIQLAALDDDLARGIGGKVGPKSYPFVQKSSVPVNLRLQTYALIGSLHCASGLRVSHVLEEKLMFLPLTNAKIRVLGNGIWRPSPFVAVNREQILSLQEVEIAPDSSPSSSSGSTTN